MKILIWDKDIPLKDSGGPAGYLYKLHEYLKQNPTDEIIFYSDIIDNKPVQEGKFNIIKKIIVGKISLKILLGKIIRRLTKKHWGNFFRIFQVYYTFDSLSDKEIALINSVDYIHFHMLSALLHYYPYFNNISSKIILTTHTPEPNLMEIENAMPSIKNLTRHNYLKNKILKREAFGYHIADYIMLPVSTAQEAYTTNCRILKEAFCKCQDKIFYVPTAIQEDVIINEKKKKEYASILSSYSFKVCFIGRHNQIKGYDKLQEIALECWQRNPSITFVIGGMEKPLTRLNDHRWIELGWVDTSALLENIDVFILPNKQTYFDLILLEVIRQGVPCIISNTGGNKWFIDKGINGMYGYEYDNVQTAADLIIQLSNKVNTEEWIDIQNNCRGEFKANFTLDKYINSYLLQIKSLKSSNLN